MEAEGLLIPGDQRCFLLAPPSLQLLFAVEGVLDVLEPFDVDQLNWPSVVREAAWVISLLVLCETPFHIVGDTHIVLSIRAAQHVHEVVVVHEGKICGSVDSAGQCIALRQAQRDSGGQCIALRQAQRDIGWGVWLRFDTPPDNAKRMIKNCHAERVEARYIHEHAWCALVRQRFGRLSVTVEGRGRQAQRDSGGECGSASTGSA